MTTKQEAFDVCVIGTGAGGGVMIQELTAAGLRVVALQRGPWKTVEAISARIIPTDHDPGAVEAGCTNFIDKALAHEDAALKPVYKAGLAGIDAVSHKRFEEPFIELSAEQQDDVLLALESGKADGWPRGDVAPAKFFEAIRVHTIIGFLADPKYGGNRDYAGWKVVGYPGGGHHLGGYSPGQLMGMEKVTAAWGTDV
jgi:gluconate 2-dehydrogenase gamma chain